jgi:hypothetical protein
MEKREKEERYKSGQHRQTYVRNGVPRKFIGYGKRRAAPFDKVLISICLDDLEKEDMVIDPNGQAWIRVLVSERLDIGANGITHNVEIIRKSVRDEKMEEIYTLKQMAGSDKTMLRHGVDSNKLPPIELKESFLNKFRKKK